MNPRQLILILYSSVSITLGQYIDSEVNLTQYPQGYLIESLSGLGLVKNVISEISNIANTNPSSMVDYHNPAIGISYQFESKIYPFLESNLNVEKKRWNEYLPHSLGAIYAICGTRIGIGLSQYYNIYEEFSPRDYIIMSNTDTDTVKITDYEKTMIVRGSLLLSQSIKHVLANNDILTLGVKYNHYRLYGNFQFFGDNYKNKVMHLLLTKLSTVYPHFSSFAPLLFSTFPYKLQQL